MYKELQQINSRPAPFQFYTAEDLWTNEHTSKRMLEYHLNGSVDVSSRNSGFIQGATEWIASRFNVNGKTVIADFGCGPGLYTTQLAEKGAIVTGIDFSERSLNYAKQIAGKRNLDINYICANYLDYEAAQKFDLIMMIMYDFCALSPQQRSAMLQKFSTMLKPDGSIVLDVYSLNGFEQREESSTYELNQLDGFWSPEDYYCFVNTFKYNTEKVILDKYSIIEKLKTRTVYNWLQYFSESSLRWELESAGFNLDQFYGDVAGHPYSADSSEFAVVASLA